MLELGAVHEPIATLLAGKLEEVAVIFERQLASDLSAVNELCTHIESYRGKMLRPTLVLLSGLAAAGEPCDGAVLTNKHLTVAAVAEMIHMATLVHDDVLDEAEMRRRGATVNILWGNEAAVMLGDYLISNAFHLCSTIGDPSINLLLGQVTNTLCEGELVQLRHRDNYGLDEATYLQIIRRKTATLIGVCCRLGGALANAGEVQTQALERFGLALGTAFQLQDDLLDLTGDAEVVGKSLGRDLDKGKLTLPVIHHLASVDSVERGRALRLIEQRDAAGLQRRLMESGAVDRASEAAAELIAEAKRELPRLPAGPARDMMRHIADAVIDRSY
ncbi:MAG: polyprenyl synthetase family protein [Phycisphaerales bacterium]|nr:MAG: polyprenyl synthetase family protein [Phycisphaerales bacterium]